MTRAETRPFAQLLIQHATWLRTMLNVCIRHAGDFSAKERAIRGPLEDWQLACESDDVIRGLQKQIADVRVKLVRVAERAFAPEGATLEIPDDLGHAEGWEAEFDPAGMWSALERRYASSGEALAFSALSRRLLSAFRELADRGDARTIGGCPVLQLSNYGTEEWSSRFQHEMVQTIDDFGAIARHSGVLDDTAAFELRHFRDFVRCNRGKVTPHTKMMVPGVFTAVLFKSKVEFRLAVAFATQLQLFLAQHGGPVAISEAA